MITLLVFLILLGLTGMKFTGTVSTGEELILLLICVLSDAYFLTNLLRSK